MKFQIGQVVRTDVEFKNLPNIGVIVRVNPNSPFPYVVRLANKDLAFAENEIEEIPEQEDIAHECRSDFINDDITAQYEWEDYAAGHP